MSSIRRIAVLGALALTLAGCEVELSAVVRRTAADPGTPPTRMVLHGALLPAGPRGERWVPSRVLREGTSGLYTWHLWWDGTRDGR